MQNSLFRKTQELVRTSRKSCREIAEATGVHPAWLWRFSRDRVSTSRGDEMQRVYEYLSGRKLEVE